MWIVISTFFSILHQIPQTRKNCRWKRVRFRPYVKNLLRFFLWMKSRDTEITVRKIDFATWPEKIKILSQSILGNHVIVRARDCISLQRQQLSFDRGRFVHWVLLQEHPALHRLGWQAGRPSAQAESLGMGYAKMILGNSQKWGDFSRTSAMIPSMQTTKAS